MRAPTSPSMSFSSARRLLLVAAAVIVVALPTSGASASGSPRATSPTRAAAVLGGGGRVLVRFARGAGRLARSSALADVDGVRIGTIYGERTEVVRVPAGSERAAAAELRSSPGVAWAARDGRARVAAAPDDPQFPQQYAWRNTGQTGGLVDADIDATEGWTQAGLTPSWPTTGGTPVGFVDTGLDTAHPEFPHARVNGCVHSTGGVISDGCKDGSGHGTHVAGIAAAATNNTTGVAGVSFDSPIYVCRAFDSNGDGFNSDVA